MGCYAKLADFCTFVPNPSDCTLLKTYLFASFDFAHFFLEAEGLMLHFVTLSIFKCYRILSTVYIWLFESHGWLLLLFYIHLVFLIGGAEAKWIFQQFKICNTTFISKNISKIKELYESDNRNSPIPKVLYLISFA